jgi:sugar phosphate permease
VAGLFLVYLAENHGPFVALRTLFWMIMAMMVLAFFVYRTPEGVGETVGRKGQEDIRSLRGGFKGILKNRTLMTLFLIAGMWGFGQGVVSTFFLLYVNESLGYPLAVASSFLAAVMMSGAAGRIFWGVISDRLFESRRPPVLTIIPLLALISVMALALWSNTWPQWLLIPVAVGIGISNWGWHGIIFLVVAELSENNAVATTVGLATTIAWFGLSLGPVGFGAISDHFGYFYGWMVFGILCICSFFLCVSLFNCGVAEPLKPFGSNC